MSNIKDRVLEVCEFKGVKKELFFKNLGLSYANFKGIQKKSALNSDAIDKIISKYTDIDPFWLITGKGNMINKNFSLLEEPFIPYNSKSTELLHEEQDIPLYDAMATASVVSLFKNPNSSDIIDTLHIPNMPKCDGAIIVTGDSMYPLIKSGDIVCYKTVQDLSNNILYGNMYLVNIDFEGDEMLLVKYIHRGEDENHWKLVSENKYHDAIEVPLQNVLSAALIKGNVRFNFTK